MMLACETRCVGGWTTIYLIKKKRRIMTM